MDLHNAPQLRWRLQSDPLLSAAVKSGDTSDPSVSVFDVLDDKYTTLRSRTEDMMVRHTTVEVENDLKQHLTRYVLPSEADVPADTI
jgi:hypothetical protein